VPKHYAMRKYKMFLVYALCILDSCMRIQNYKDSIICYELCINACFIYSIWNEIPNSPPESDFHIQHFRVRNTTLLTLQRRVLLEKLTVTQLVKKFLTIHRTQRFITVFTKAHQWILS